MAGAKVINKLTVPFLCLLLVGWTIAAAAQQSDRLEQQQFGAEDETVRNPVTIPQEVRELLSKEEMVRDAANFDHIAPEKFPASWFLASMVHLSSGDEQDLILIGRGPMLGANITQFWVFRATTHGYNLVLQAAAHDLVVMNRMQNELREIQLLSATAIRFHTVILRFQGGRYRVFRDTWEDISR